jgi:glutathione S-transferase
MPCKIYTNYPWNPYVAMCRVVAEAAGAQCEMVVVDEEKKNSAEHKKINMTGKYPLLETEEGCLNESVAIAKYLADGHATLLGVNSW